jgi:hypothetical protein
VILKYAKKCDTKMIKKHLFTFGVIGYIIGITSCVFFLIVFEAAQPALLYLAPSVLGVIIVQAKRKRCLLAIWTGIFPAKGPDQAYELTSDTL